MLEPGEMAGAGSPVLQVDDLGVVEFTAYLPEAYYGRVVEGKTLLQASVHGEDIAKLLPADRQIVVTTKSPTIHPRLRTFEIKALLRDPPSVAVPGSRAELGVILLKRTGPGVPRASVIRRSNGLVIFTVSNGKAKMLPVKTGLESDGWVEVIAEGISKDLPVVSMGQGQLNDGTSVIEVKEGTE